MKLTFVTGNKFKLAEVKQLLDFEIDSAKLELPEIQSLSSEEVAIQKAKDAYIQLEKPLIIEETGVFINALNGFPGPLIHWFGESFGFEDTHRLLKDYDDKSAVAKVVIAYHNGNEIHTFVGEIEGKIVEPRGGNGFGWDSIFEVEDTGKTFGEFDDYTKEVTSMRKIAVEKLKEFISNESS